jgi:hypothetical protein
MNTRNTPTGAVPEPADSPFHREQRFDVYVSEPGSRVVLYSNVLFSAALPLLTPSLNDSLGRFVELTQPNGSFVYIPKSAIVKFCVHGVILTGENVVGKDAQKT